MRCMRTLAVALATALVLCVSVAAADPAATPAPATVTPNAEAVKSEGEKLAALDSKLDADEENYTPPKPLSEEEIKQLQAWAGHLKPLGSGNTKTPVSEISAVPSVNDFFETYVVKSVPVILRGAAVGQPASDKWTDEYLAGVAGANKTRVVAETGKKEDRNRTEDSTYPTFAEFIANYSTHDMYLIHDVLNSLKPDYLIPTVLDCPAITPTLTRSLMHMSSGGTKSVLHHEHYDDIHCVLDGSKTFLLVDPAKNKDHLFIDSDDPETGEYISVDVDSVDAVKYPGMPKVEFLEATVNKGDCIYLPAVWLQADRTSSARHLGVSIWWQRDGDSDAKVKDCPAAAPAARTPTSNVTFVDEQRYLMDKKEVEADFEKAARDAENDLISLISEDPDAAAQFAKRLMDEIHEETGPDAAAEAPGTSPATKVKDEL